MKPQQGLSHGSLTRARHKVGSLMNAMKSATSEKFVDCSERTIKRLSSKKDRSGIEKLTSEHHNILE